MAAACGQAMDSSIEFVVVAAEAAVGDLAGGDVKGREKVAIHESCALVVGDHGDGDVLVFKQAACLDDRSDLAASQEAAEEVNFQREWRFPDAVDDHFEEEV